MTLEKSGWGRPVADGMGRRQAKIGLECTGLAGLKICKASAGKVKWLFGDDLSSVWTQISMPIDIIFAVARVLSVGFHGGGLARPANGILVKTACAPEMKNETA